MTKKSYRVRNWREYNKALTQRGSLTLWIAPSIEKKWYAKESSVKRRGRRHYYSDFAIETCTTLRLLFNLALRQGYGFIDSVFRLMQLTLPIPSPSQQCRRQKALATQLQHHVKGRIHVVVDSSGLKVFGEGEWKVRCHGYSKRRIWRKLHIGIDSNTQEIVMATLTKGQASDSKQLPDLLTQYADGFSKVGGDKGYDAHANHQCIGQYDALSIILPQRKAKIRKRRRNKEPTLVRDDIIRYMYTHGRKRWKRERDYHRRSLVETAFFRFKKLFGGKLKAHSFENQKIEALISCNILNRLTQLGMPDSVITN